MVILENFSRPKDMLAQQKKEGMLTKAKERVGKFIVNLGTRLLPPDTIFTTPLERALYGLDVKANSEISSNLSQFLRKVVMEFEKFSSASLYLISNGDFNNPSLEHATLEHHTTVKLNKNGEFETSSYVDSINLNSQHKFVEYVKSSKGHFETAKYSIYEFNLIPDNFNIDLGDSLIKRVYIPLTFDEKTVGLFVIEGDDLSLRGEVANSQKVKNLHTLTYAVCASRHLADILEHRSDSLTRLRLRRTFDKKIKEAVEKYKTEGKNFSLLMLDIDHFKRINDTCGHLVGDKVLRRVAEAMLNSIGNSEEHIACRYGGEEFAIILNCDIEKAIDVAYKIREKIRGIVLKEKNKKNENVEINVTCSIGVGDARSILTVPLSTGLTEAASYMVSVVDSALYYVKANGRNNIAKVEIEDNTMRYNLNPSL
jgi:diguanylate cyclase (GGDEF)-like protein